VVFSATISVEIDFAVAFLPIFLYLFSSLIAFATLYLVKKSWSDPTGNILAFTAGTGNTGYFGIPLAMIFFDTTLANIYIFTVLSSLLYENTTGFYVTSKGNYTAKESLQKIIKLPILHAFVLGLVCNLMDIGLPQTLITYSEQFKGAYGILGMMMLGMGLHGFRMEEDLDLRFITIAFVMKFLFWPLSIWGFIFLDTAILHLLNEDLYRVLILFAIVPLAGNSVSLAVLLHAKPEKISLAVFLSTVISVVFIPVILYLYGGF
jgi:predicted permease